MKPPRRRVNKVGGLRRWPFDILRVGELWTAILTPREAQSARNSAYQYGQRTGKRFMTGRGTLVGHRQAIAVERVK